MQQTKQDIVRDVFDRVAPRYDVMNDLMSGGLHRLWKARLIDALYLASPHRLPDSAPLRMLDVAGGTGDIAVRAAHAAHKRGIDLRIQVVDVNCEMLAVGMRRLHAKPDGTDIDFMAGNAECLPIAGATIDIYTIAFGIRNITHRDRALREAMRVLKPGGRFVCLEFSHPRGTPLRALYDAYSHHVIPALGQWVAGDGAPYQYLVESIRQFPHPRALAREIEQAGLARVGFERLSGGIATLHYGWRL